MEFFNKKPTLAVDNTSSSSDDTRSVASNIPTQQTVVKKSRSPWSTVAFFFLLLLLISLGVSAWLWSSWQSAQNQTDVNKSELTASQSTIANLREQLGKATGQAVAESNQPVNDEALIKSAVQSYNGALASSIKDPVIEVTKKDGSQALISVGNGSVGYNAYVKKVNTAWVVVWSGQNTPSDEVVKQFDLKL